MIKPFNTCVQVCVPFYPLGGVNDASGATEENKNPADQCLTLDKNSLDGQP